MQYRGLLKGYFFKIFTSLRDNHGNAMPALFTLVQHVYDLLFYLFLGMLTQLRVNNMFQNICL